MSYIWIETQAEHASRFPNAPAAWTLDGWEGEGLYHKKRGTAFPQANRSELCAPMVMRDTPEYQSVVSDKWITSRSHRREDLKRTNCFELDREYGRGMPRKPHKHPLLNEAFAKRNRKPELVDHDRAQDHKRARKAISDGIQKNLYGKGL